MGRSTKIRSLHKHTCPVFKVIDPTMVGTARDRSASTPDAVADMVCDAKDVKGGGHFALVYDSPEHYAGKVTMDAVAEGHPVKTTMSFEAHWISADCKEK